MSQTSKWIGRRLCGLVPLVAFVLAVTACAQVEPFEYTEIHEIQPGPGLLSDEEGEFIIYDSSGNSIFE